MLKKTLFISLLGLFCLVGQLQAQSDQTIEFGFKGGLNFNKLVASQSGWQSEDLRMGLVAGAYLQVNFNNFYIQPEFIFSQKGGNLRAKDNLGNSEDLKRTLGTADVPIMVGLRLLNVIRLQAGPILSFPIGGNQSEEDPNSNYDDSINDFILGYQAGIGLDIKRLRIDLRYEGNLSKIGNNLPSGIRTDDRISTFQFTVGYQIF
jgi:hypothetical protein